MLNGYDTYRFRCTLSFGDIYAQVIAWLIVILISLGTALAAMATNPIFAFATVGLVLVISLPFLLFAFVTTLFNHIELFPITETSTAPEVTATPVSAAA